MPARRVSLLLVAILAAPAVMAVPLPQEAVGIGPGTHLLTTIDGRTFSCTAGWVWRDAGAYYLSAAGHCFLPIDATATHGPGADSAGASRVRACIASCSFGGTTGFFLTGQLVDLGPLVYARQAVGTTEIGNDFGLVRIPDALLSELRPGLPVWGKASRTRDVVPGDVACFYGAGSVVGETSHTMARAGVGVLTLADGSWRVAAPSNVGDSGAAMATCTPDGRAVAAVGVITHLSSGGIAGTTMARGQEMAREAGLHIVPHLG